jgi:hypothetical protein
MLVTPHDVTNFTPRLSPRAEQHEGVRPVFRIYPRSPSGSAFPIESGSDFAIGFNDGVMVGLCVHVAVASHCGGDVFFAHGE